MHCRLRVVRSDKLINLGDRKFSDTPAVGQIIEGSGPRGINAYEVVRIVHRGMESPDSCDLWLVDRGQADLFEANEATRIRRQYSPD